MSLSWENIYPVYAEGAHIRQPICTQPVQFVRIWRHEYVRVHAFVCARVSVKSEWIWRAHTSITSIINNNEQRDAEAAHTCLPICTQPVQFVRSWTHRERLTTIPKNKTPLIRGVPQWYPFSFSLKKPPPPLKSIDMFKVVIWERKMIDQSDEKRVRRKRVYLSNYAWMRIT